MLKKILIASMLIGSSAALADGVPYLGFDLGLVNNTAKHANFRGLNGTVNAGYGSIVGTGIYLGSEIFFTPVATTISDNGLKSTYAYGLSFIPGLMLSDHTMGYARLGLSRSHFSPAGGAHNKTVSGFSTGLGIQTSLTQNWDLRGEYIYTAYQSISVVGTPRSDQVNLGLVYKFE
jgi:opacity protein-like surface antigen